MANGKMNWAGLQAYTVQPSDMELFQTYMTNLTKGFIASGRTKGILFGGRISTVSGMQLKLSEGLAQMPDGQIVSFPEMTFIIPVASSSNPRIDRIELSYALVNNTQVQNVSAQNLTLDVLYVSSIDNSQGTPSSTPVAPSRSSSKLSLGLISVGQSQTSILAGNISQDEDTAFDTSAVVLGNKNGFIRMNQTLGLLQYSNNGAQYSSFASGGGGGGGGGANWTGAEGASPIEVFEFGEKSLAFSLGDFQSASLWVKVPASYLPGAPISLRLAHYSPSASGNFKFITTTTLIRKNIDAVSSTTNQYVSTNLDIVNSVANKYLEIEYALSSPLGIIGGAGASAGDLILVSLSRVTPAGTEDTEDVRMIPSSTEIAFS